MDNIKIFPSFTLPNNSDKNDKLFLQELTKVNEQCGALHTNFSYFDYSVEHTNSSHFVTYPLDWITHYIKSESIKIDPLFKLDYRLVTIIDWADIQSTKEAEGLFNDFAEYGLGNNGISVVTPLSHERFGILSLSFKITKTEWSVFKNENFSNFKILSDIITKRYDEIYNSAPATNYKITRRERECLYWVAIGKTDEQIAEILSIGKWTVVSHLKSAKYKLKCTNRSSAVATAISLKIVELKK